MNLLQKISAIFLLITITCCAQKTTFSEDVVTYIENNGTANQYNYAYDELLKMLANQFPETDSNAKGWEYMNSSKDKHVSEMIALLAPVYEKNFTHDEIKSMNAFYLTDAGKQLVTDGSNLSESQKKEVNDFYSSTTGKKIMEKQPVLAAEISKVSEDWSRGLYETALSMLK